ncbi:calcium:proton antiporter, partial [Photobacterium sp. BZF1]|nr:calcium:proton antiporter [Photobacterium sp. BZF1]
MLKILKQEYTLVVGMLAILFFKMAGNTLLGGNNSPILYLLTTGILFYVVMTAIFAVVRHSDAMAIRLGDPYGTLILTLSVVVLKVIMLSSLMLTGDSNPVLARDTLFALIM